MSRSTDPADLLRQARDGSRPALARLLSYVERGGALADTTDGLVWAHGGHAYTVGMTGAPGAGKSTLTSAVIAHLRSRQQRVAVLAIDPSSPFSGGAILGDRVRMGDHSLDDDVFIRSMATRGHLGGLALAAPAAVRVLDAVGTDWVLLETVGVGQVEVEVAGTADTTVVVVNPGWGDAVQANKAGLLEIADVFVINKADRDGAAATRRDLEGMLELSAHSAWQPPIVETIATESNGIPELVDAVAAHRAHLEASGRLDADRTTRVRRELEALVAARFEARARAVAGTEEFEAVLTDVVARALDPASAAARLSGC